MLGVMAQPHPDRDIPALHHRAIDNLHFIRSTMERATSFTGIPGWGSVAMGVTALAAAWLASRAGSGREWLITWMLEAVVALVIGSAALARKVHRIEGYVLTQPARRFLLGYLPPVIAGGILTVVLVRAGHLAILPGTWLLLYGTALLTGGAFSVPVVPAMGASFALLGILAFITSPALGDFWMAVGFGALHVVFGFHIARRHGG